MMDSSRVLRAGLVSLAVAGLACSGVLAVAEAAVPAAQHSTTMAVPVDRQAYVTSSTSTNPVDGTTIDAYDADPSSIHVAVNGGEEFARSFVHVALDYLPPHATATKVVMTLHVTQQSDASNTGVYPIYNVNNAQAIVEACALTSELKSNFDSSHPPGYDCAHGSAVGKQSKDNLTWTFDLTQLIAYWHEHGNTGAALIPIGSGESGQTWSVAFYRSRATSQVSFASAPVSKPTTTLAPHHAAPATPAAGGGGGTTGSGSGATSAPLPPVSSTLPAPQVSAGVLPPSLAPSSPTGQPSSTTAAPSSGGGSTPAWPWVLVGSFLIAAGALAWPHRAAILAGVPRLGALWRTHPRSYSVAAAALAWGLAFTGYSIAPGPSQPSSALASDQGTTAPLSAGTSSSAPTSGGHAGAAGVGASTIAGTTSTGATSASTGSPVAGSGQPSTTAQQAVQSEFSKPGTYKVINGVRVFFPADGSAPVADLYHGADDVVGLTNDQIRICAHAALTYGSAFHISASDLDVFWTKVNKEMGGIFGRQVVTNYQNDNYDPGTAVQAAQTCKDWSTFLLLGGIGFDQIPAVRQWAEQNHMLYLHHIATIEGSAGLRYSFSALPTVEQTGTYFGELVARQFAGKKIAIIYRQSSNWTPALAPFKQRAEAAGATIVGEYGVQINQGNYTQELTEARSAGAQVVFAWDNALAEIEMLKQAQGQNWHPAWLVNGFNIITNTLGSTALDQDMWSAAEWDAYDPNYYGGGFASYAAQIHEFEAEYKKYDPSADLTGDGGDLLFLNWESQKRLYDLLLTCGKDCTRNRLAGVLLAGYHKVTPPNCPASFEHTSDHHHGGYMFNVLHAVRDPNGRANFVPVTRCVTSY
jgi:hypothetical protein